MMDSTYATGLDQRNEPYIRCLICHKDSFDQADIDNAYCANCDLMHNEGRKRNRRDVIEYQLRQALDKDFELRIEHQLRQALDKDFELRFVSLGESTEQDSFWKEAQKTCPCGSLGSSALWMVFFVATTAFAVCTMFGALIGELVAKDSTRGLFYGALAGVLIDMVGLSLIFRQSNDTGKVLWAKPWEVRQQSTNKEDSA